MHHRIHVPAGLAADSEITIGGDEMHHAARVVRVRPGEAVELFDGEGLAFSGEVVEVTAAGLRVRVEAPVPSRESPLDLTLAMAIIQLDKFELVLQKATELGVRALIPLVTDHGEVRPERYRGKGERWEKIVFEAVKQCGRSRIPRLFAPAALDEVVLRPGLKMIFDADTEPGPRPGTIGSVTIFIGPEGGWSKREIAVARQHECLFATLGPRRLRAETAAIVASGIIAALSGDI